MTDELKLTLPPPLHGLTLTVTNHTKATVVVEAASGRIEVEQRHLFTGDGDRWKDQAILGDCECCDGYVLDASEAPLCPTCARLKREADSA
jgi:hypothetical protein